MAISISYLDKKCIFAYFDLIFLGQKWQFASVYYTAGQKAYWLVCGHFIVVIEWLTGGSIHNCCRAEEFKKKNCNKSRKNAKYSTDSKTQL